MSRQIVSGLTALSTTTVRYYAIIVLRARAPSVSCNSELHRLDGDRAIGRVVRGSANFCDSPLFT